MDNLKIDIIKKLLMLDTKVELEKVSSFVGNSISRECQQDEKDKIEFRKWQEEKQKEDTDEIPF